MATTPVTISGDLLLSWASARAGIGAGVALSPSVSGNPSAGSTVKAPWQDATKQTPASELVKRGLSGKAFFDASAKTFSQPNATPDELKLFALYTGLNTLAALAGRFDQKGVTSAEQGRLASTFDAGLKQLDAFLSSQKFAALSVLRGAKNSSVKSEASVGAVKSTYTTGVVSKGNPDTANGVFDGDLSFHVDAVDAQSQNKSFDIDLAGMGATPRSLNNVVAYINSQLRAAGLTSHFSAVKQAPVNGQDQYALKIDVAVGEDLSFAAASTAPAMYMTTGANHLTKISDPSGGVTTNSLGSPNTVFDKLVAQGATIHASATDADGSLYVVADANGSVGGQAIKGVSDAVLYKYDSAGNLLFTRTLGADSSASGVSLAISGDGKVAIAGTVTGSLSDKVTAKATGADQFVTVFDASGVEQWTTREEKTSDGEASAVAFGADGSVYVGGRQKNAAGEWEGTLQTFSPTGTLRDPQNLGPSNGVNGLVVEDMGGSQRVTVASVEAGKAVLRQFDDTGAAINVGAVRNLGPLGGGDIVGLQLVDGNLYLGGNTKVGGLSVGATGNAFSGGQDGFVAKLAADLSANPSEQVSYIGGAGDDHIAGFGVSGGKIWVGGDSDKAFAGQDTLSDKRDGFVARLGAGGALEWAQRISGGKDGYKATTFTLDDAGASALDRLGLPQGNIEIKDPKDLVSGSSVRVGDQFTLSVNGRLAQTITIKEGDTLQKLADRINAALLSAGKASVSFGGADGDNLRIVSTASNRIELRAGGAGKDALAGLGIPEGVIVADTPVKSTAVNKKAPPPVYGLGLSSTMSLADKASRQQAVIDIGNALATIQKAFKTLTTPVSNTPQITGKAPAYLQKELANYQAALARLSSG